MQSLRYDIALIPDDVLSQKTIQTSRELQQFDSLFVLQDDAYFPHVSLYMVYLRPEDVTEVKRLLAEIASQTPSFDLTATHYQQSYGYIDVEYQYAPALSDLQMAVVDVVNPLRSIVHEKPESWMRNAHPAVRKNFEAYGHSYVGELFRPHVTFTRFTNDRSIDLAHLPEPGVFSGKFMKLGLFELGDHGTCLKEVAEFNLT